MNFLITLNRKYRLIPSAVLAFLAIAWMTPTVGLFITSLRPLDEAMTKGWWTVFPKIWSNVWTLEPYTHVFKENNFGQSIISTFAIAIPATILPILIAAYAAYGFTFFEFKGREFSFGLLIGLMVIPGQVAFIPVLQFFAWFTEKTSIPLLGEYPAAWLVHIAFAMPLAVYLFRNYMMTLPTALIEAARIDGASHYQIFWRLVIPMSIPALASFAIFQFLWIWNDYLVAFLFVGTNHPVLQTTLFQMLGRFGDGWQYVAAGSFISMTVPLIVFFSLQRYFVRGLTAGAVK